MYKDDQKNEAKFSLIFVIIIFSMILAFSSMNENNYVMIIYYLLILTAFVLLSISLFVYSILIEGKYLNIRTIFGKKKILIENIKDIRYRKMLLFNRWRIYLYLESGRNLNIVVHNLEEVMRML